MPILIFILILIYVHSNVYSYAYPPGEWCYDAMIMAFTHLCQKSELGRARELMLRTIKATRTILGADSKVVGDLIAIIRED